MPQKFSDEHMRTSVDIRPGYDPDARNSSNNYSGGETRWPGDGEPVSQLRYGGVKAYENTVRDVRVGDVANYGNGQLGPMELAGKSVTPALVPAMVKFAGRPIKGPGPLEEQRLTQQQNNAIAMGDPDYSPFRELDYESIKEANFSRPSQKSVQKPDKDFGR
jgi:hypothetical protein